MIDLPLLITAGAIMTVAAYIDVKTLEVPDWLNYSGIAAGIGIHLIYSLQQWSWLPIMFSAIGLAIGLALGSLMFYTGQWGGGDAKLLMATGALIGFEPSRFAFGASYMINLVFIGGIWGIIWSIWLAVKNRTKFIAMYAKIRHINKYRRIRMIGIISAGIMIIASFAIPELRLELLGLALASYFLCHMVVLMKAVELSSMHKWVTPLKLTEGDWLLKPVIAGKTRIEPPRLGLGKKELRILKNLYAQKKITKVHIKYGLPFTPAFLITFIATLMFGNIMISVFF